ncbi:PelD GGDEF domain-containing protein [Comamonas sp. 26]|uniref:PelD GGDEF domain-containing protein n=1 Tax=Comamonas sp. 26 TaxID=2035201 RepID=UPI000C175810|nr:PelD GGDEF domain-containing protein [Comamonas sp. 26]PIG00486.1 PelD-like GGDEF domain-containing protein [Comamonas sp. 26]
MHSQEIPVTANAADSVQRIRTSDEFKGSPLGKLTVVSEKPWVIVAETVLIPAFALLLGYLVNRPDPLWINADFPWAWFAPMIIALRYGPIAGLFSAGILLLGWAGLNQQDFSQFPQQYFLGGLIMVMIVGEVSSVWRNHLRRAQTARHYQDQRLEQLVRQHYLLRLSHDQLEQQLIGQPVSMRDALHQLRDLKGTTSDAQTLLNLLSQFCQINVASIVPFRSGRLSDQSIAQIGGARSINQDDALVQQALSTQSLCHISRSLKDGQNTSYVVAAPLLDLSGEMYGMLVVEEMPFFALQEETLQTVNLLLGYYTDSIAANNLAQPLLQVHPECPPQFAFELQRMEHVLQSSQLPSIVLALQLSPKAIALDMPQFIMRMERMLDQSWLLEGREKSVLAILMPLGSFASSEGFLNRLSTRLEQRGFHSIEEAGIIPHTLPIQKNGSMRVLDEIVRIAHA